TNVSEGRSRLRTRCRVGLFRAGLADIDVPAASELMIPHPASHRAHVEIGDGRWGADGNGLRWVPRQIGVVGWIDVADNGDHRLRTSLVAKTSFCDRNEGILPRRAGELHGCLFTN